MSLIWHHMYAPHKRHVSVWELGLGQHWAPLCPEIPQGQVSGVGGMGGIGVSLMGGRRKESPGSADGQYYRNLLTLPEQS